MELPVINHPDYVAKINDDNKFPIKKFGALAEYLLKEGLAKRVACICISEIHWTLTSTSPVW